LGTAMGLRPSGLGDALWPVGGGGDGHIMSTVQDGGV
jgi:hypothetical protein